MFVSHWHILRAALVVLAASLLITDREVLAQTSANPIVTEPTVLEQINRYSSFEQDNSMSQVTNVHQLRDVSPKDWAYEALRSLFKRYGCVIGYPDGTLGGNQALTRFEFAASLDACLQQVERSIATSTAIQVTRDDLETMRRLNAEFQVELSSLKKKLDTLEAHTATLAENQFSTTTKLSGEITFDATSTFGGKKADGSGEDIEDNIVFSERVRLNFSTSFTGEDLLFSRIQAGNFPLLNETTGTDMASKGITSSTDNEFFIQLLWYKFPVSDNLIFHVGVVGMRFDTLTDEVNPLFEYGLSSFTLLNPVVYNAPFGQGVGANIILSDSISFDLAYLASNGDSPENKKGLFNGAYSAMAQLNFGALEDTFRVAFTYARTYQPGGEVDFSGGVGSEIAQDPFDDRAAASSDRFGVQTSWRVNPSLNIGGWVGYVNGIAESGLREGDRAEVWNWLVNVAFLDVGYRRQFAGFCGGYAT